MIMLDLVDNVIEEKNGIIFHIQNHLDKMGMNWFSLLWNVSEMHNAFNLIKILWHVS